MELINFALALLDDGMRELCVFTMLWLVYI